MEQNLDIIIGYIAIKVSKENTPLNYINETKVGTFANLTHLIKLGENTGNPGWRWAYDAEKELFYNGIESIEDLSKL